MYIYIYIHTYTHTHIYIYTYIHTYIHIYIYIYIHIYICSAGQTYRRAGVGCVENPLGARKGALPRGPEAVHSGHTGTPQCARALSVRCARHYKSNVAGAGGEDGAAKGRHHTARTGWKYQ